MDRNIDEKQSCGHCIEQNFINQINLTEYSYRQSFERFCDDLCEVIVSYLPLEEKVCLECVSKQFQRCVYTSVYSIESNHFFYPIQSVRNPLRKSCINNSESNATQLENNENHRWDSWLARYRVVKQIREQMNVPAVESILKKCKFITKISLKGEHVYKSEQTLALITKYCSYLNDIEFCFDRIKEQTLREFGIKFGPKLRTIRFFGTEPISDSNQFLLKFLTSVRTIYWATINDVVHRHIPLCPKLTKIHFYDIIDTELMTIFVDNHKSTLKSLSLSFDELYNWNYDKSLETLSHLENLEQFKLTINLEEETFPLKLIDCLKYFCQIKYLRFSVLQTHLELPELKDLPIKSMTEFKCLTHLELDYPKLKDNFIRDIHLYLPELQYLEILVVDMTDNHMKSLSNLKSLQFLRINSRKKCFKHLTDQGISRLIKKCVRLESIVFSDARAVSDETIDELRAKFVIKKIIVIFKMNPSKNLRQLKLLIK